MDYKEQRDLEEISNQIDSLVNDWENLKSSFMALFGSVKKQYEIDHPPKPRIKWNFKLVSTVIVISSLVAGFMYR